MKSLIFGYVKTGRSFEKYLKNKNINFDIYDADSSILPKSEKTKNIKPTFENLQKYKDIYISPGIKIEDYFTKRNINNLNFISDLDIFFHENNSYKIGVTGTNGKSTLVQLLEQALNFSSSAIALGNIGYPLLEYISHSIITNIERDHIKYHGTFQKYKEAKLKICRRNIKSIFCDNDDYGAVSIKVAKELEPDCNYKNLKLSFLKKLVHDSK